uniref:Hypothetical chloroplast protein RF12 n=1 Tax=Koshicola spirodelophila TaxID=1707787 RepID=A0A167MFV4_9CHLO|nr:hypothetical chloroplast protein RF12 [Koshicola spirodelophila]
MNGIFLLLSIAIILSVGPLVVIAIAGRSGNL